MTQKKPDPRLQVPPFIDRPHYACRLRKDLSDVVKAECARLNCSQGVYLEVLIAKGLAVGLVGQHDVFHYSSEDRWLHSLLRDGDISGLHPDLQKALQVVFEKLGGGR